MTALLPLLVLSVVAGTATWVYSDAQRRDADGYPVVVTFGPFTLGSPGVWAAACVIVWILILPLYLVARRT